jgi:hypothetical protein
MYRHILIPTDGSELAQKAVTHGLSLAKSVGAKVALPERCERLLPGLSGRRRAARLARDPAGQGHRHALASRDDQGPRRGGEGLSRGRGLRAISLLWAGMELLPCAT